MEYIVSRPYELPNTAAELGSTFFFQLWGRRYWPYRMLEIGEVLYWYYSRAKNIVWKSRTIDVERFAYHNKDTLREKLELRFGSFDHEEPYFVDGTNSGYCLAYKVEALERIVRPKPERLRFPRLGWLRVDSPEVVLWVSKP